MEFATNAWAKGILQETVRAKCPFHPRALSVMVVMAGDASSQIAPQHFRILRAKEKAQAQKGRGSKRADGAKDLAVAKAWAEKGARDGEKAKARARVAKTCMG